MRRESPMEFVSCKEMSRRSNGAFSEEFVRSACHRSADNHPLPHVKCGKKRPVLRVCPDVFWNWIEEEMKHAVA